MYTSSYSPPYGDGSVMILSTPGSAPLGSPRPALSMIGQLRSPSLYFDTLSTSRVEKHNSVIFMILCNPLAAIETRQSYVSTHSRIMYCNAYNMVICNKLPYYNRKDAINQASTPLSGGREWQLHSHQHGNRLFGLTFYK